MIVSMSATEPPRWTGRISRVCGVIAAAIFVASIWNVSMSVSTNTGSAFSISTALIVATNVYGGTITSSPAPMPIAASAVSSADVPLAVARQACVPVTVAYCVSKALTCPPPPRPHLPLLSTETSACSSRAS